MSMSAEQARIVAMRLSSHDNDRHRHVASVARAAESSASTVESEDRELLVVAAWLHDIGYAPKVARTGLHSLDGARYLRDAGFDERLCRLVANHTHAWVEAETRGLAQELEREFPREDSLVADALTYADLTTGPTGERVTVHERIAEIYTRYPAGSVVHESIRRAEADLVATVERVEQRLLVAADCVPPR